MSRESDRRADGPASVTPADDPDSDGAAGGLGAIGSVLGRGRDESTAETGPDGTATDGTTGDAPGPSDAPTDDRDGDRDGDARVARSGGDRSGEDDRVGQRRVERLEAENTRLRRAYERAVETNYRKTAAGFGLVGAVAALAALAFPDARQVLVALAGTGLFAAVLTLYLSPERFVAADVGERVYAAQAHTHERLVAELGVSDHRVYLPAAGERVATLFVPQFDDYVLPTGPLDETLVVPDDERARGVAFTPTGGSLFEAVERTLGGSLDERPGPVLDQLTEALAASLEVVDATEVDVAPDGTGADVAVYGSVYGDGTRFDDPVVSLLAVGLAVALDRPVAATVSPGVADGDADDYVASFRWDRDEGSDPDGDTQAASVPTAE